LRRSSPHAARVFALLALLGCVEAYAQPAAQAAVSQWNENNGIRFGPGRLHPYLDIEMSYDSAAIYEPTQVNNPSSPYVLDPEILMHFRPGFRLDVPGNDITFGLNAFYDYVWFTGILTAGSQAASLSEAGADMHAEMNTQGAVEVDVGDTFSRNARPQDIGVGTAVVSLYNQLRLRTPIHPGGRAFEVIPHGWYTTEFFSSYSGLPPGAGPCPPGTCSNTPSVQDYQDYAGGLDIHWKFLPQTALVFESNYEGRAYFNSPTGGGTVLPGSVLQMVAGLQGLVTPKIQTILKAGYAIGFNGAASTFIGRFEGTWTPTEYGSLTLGVLRDVNNAVGAASATDLRFYLTAKLFLIGRLQLHGEFAYDLVSFTQGRGGEDQLLGFDIGADFAVTKWLVVAGGYAFSKRSSDYVESLPLNYSRNQVYLRVTFTY
jgi:hypothetical protein